jgi:uncharacterized membrane protein YeaQ/YmgE (transglycosylase-associated protein family)
MSSRRNPGATDSKLDLQGFSIKLGLERASAASADAKMTLAAAPLPSGKERSMGILAVLLIGAVAGWLAGLIVRGAGFGLIGNIVIGIIGALVASWLLPQLGVSLGGSAIRDIVNATIGAVIVLVILSLIRR